MSSLPTALDFPATEEEICKRWEEEDTFKQQNKLAKDRDDEVCCWLCYFISFIHVLQHEAFFIGLNARCIKHARKCSLSIFRALYVRMPSFLFLFLAA